MGTYTTNYQLYMPTVGETGWGTLVNGNFTTIDTTMKSLSNRITAVENEVNGNLSCTSVTTSGNITGNGGIVGTTGTFSGAVSGTSGTFDYIGLRATKTTTATDYVYATCAAQALGSTTTAKSVTIPGYTYTSLPMKIYNGVYITSASGNGPSATTRTLTAKFDASSSNRYFYFKKSSDSSYTQYTLSSYGSVNITVTIGNTYNYYFSDTYMLSATLAALPTYYLATKSP